MARPRLKINSEEVRKLAEIHCTMEEMAHFFNCSVDTLERRFADVIAQARAGGKMSLRRKQYDLAMKGNASLLIFLGKVMLGQKDCISISTSDDCDGFQFEYSDVPQLSRS